MRKTKNKLEFRWKTDEPNFEMPIDVINEGKKIRVYATNNWKISNFKITKLTAVDVLKDRFFIELNQQ